MENYKEKYEKALEIIEGLYNIMKYLSSSDALLASQTIEKAFPELIEDEDERIKSCIRICITDTDEQRFMDFNTTLKDCLAWLEKQGEQKPADWSEEDEKMWSQVINEIEAIKSNSSTIFEKNIAQDKIDWLNSIKDRVQPQPEQEWSEEDNKIVKELIRYLPYCDDISKDTKERWILWLKSLKPNNWKPSEQNIKDLEWCADLVKDKMGVGFHRLQVFIDEIKKL